MYLITQSQVCVTQSDSAYTNSLDKQTTKALTNRQSRKLFHIQHVYILCAGTRKERGLVEWAAESSSGAGTVKTDTYDFPIGMGLVRRLGCLRYLPICPTFQGFKPSCHKYEEEDIKINGGVTDAPGETVCTKI